MGLISQASENVAASGAKVVTSAGTALYGLTSLPLSSVAAAVSILLSLIYIWGALPRMWRTAVGLKRGVFNKDWSLWQKLGDQPTPTKDD